MSAVFISSNQNVVNPTLEAFEPPKSFGQKVASAFIPHYDLSHQVQSIKGRVQKDPAYALNAQEVGQLKEAFIQSNAAFGGKLLKELTQLPPNEILKALMLFMEEKEGSAHVHPTIEKFLQLLDAEGLKKMTGLDDQKVKEHIQVQTLLKDTALQNVLKVKGKAVWKELHVEIYYFIHHLIEVFIGFTGLAEVQEHSKRNAYNAGNMATYEAQGKIQAYLALLGLPSVLFASVLALLGSAAAAGIVTGGVVLGVLIMIPLYMRYLRPCPKAYEGLENLNMKVMEKESPPIFKRRDVLARIQNAFLAGKGVILTAGPGVGKTSVVDSLAELIVSNQSEKLLANTQVFSANAGKIAERGMSGLDFSGLDNSFKKHSKEVVFFFDEIESIFKENLMSGKRADSLLTFHDKYRNIICATTTEQYHKTIKDKEPAFNRRFVHIEIQPLEKSELEIALYENLHFKASELNLEEDVISYLIEKASDFNPKTSQVDAANSLLSAAIVKATVLSGGRLENKMNALNLKVDSLQKNLLHKGPSSKFTEEIKEYEQLTKALKKKKAELAKRQLELDKIKKLEQTCLTLKKSTYTLASEVKNQSVQKTQEWLKKQAYHKILSEFLTQKKTKIGLPTCISKELIDQIVREV